MRSRLLKKLSQNKFLVRNCRSVCSGRQSGQKRRALPPLLEQKARLCLHRVQSSTRQQKLGYREHHLSRRGTSARKDLSWIVSSRQEETGVMFSTPALGEAANHSASQKPPAIAGRPASEAAAEFTLDDIVQHPLPGYNSPSAISFSPDDTVISYLHSPDGTLSRRLYVFETKSGNKQLLVTPPGGGVDESSLSTEEKLRRERQRERGLGVTRYDWSKNAAVPRVMVPLPGGVSSVTGIFILFFFRISPFLQHLPAALLRFVFSAATCGSAFWSML